MKIRLKSKYVISLLIILSGFIVPSISAQKSAALDLSIKGIVKDSITTRTIPFSTISLSSCTNPKQHLKRIAADANGSFVVKYTQYGDYIVTVESVGMLTQVREVHLTADRSQIDLGTVLMSMSQTNLSEITVKATPPLVKMDIDKISYDTKSDPESVSLSLLDMLRKVPLVTVDGEDKIQLKGMTNFKILINGKSTGMMANNPAQVLRSMPASNVKTIEVITEPGAKYDAEGVGGIINIVTNRSMVGFSGGVRASLKSFEGYNNGIYISSKVGKFGITSAINYNYTNSPSQIWEGNKVNNSPVATKYIHQYSLTDGNYRFYYGNLEASYEFDSLNLISLTVGGYGGGSRQKESSHTISMDQYLDTLSAFSQLKNEKNNWAGIDLSLDYQRTFSKPEQMLTISYKLGHNPDHTNNRNELFGIKNYSDLHQQILSDAYGDEHTFQLDYTEPFRKRHIVEFGAKYILRLNKSDNRYLRQNPVLQVWEQQVDIANDQLDQQQNILAAYGSYALKFDRFSVKAGLRYEHTWSDIALMDTSFQVKFINVVPSLSFLYKLNGSSSLKLSYNQRISRPGIWYLNPMLDNSNPYSISQGNPNLQPETDNSVAFNYSYITPKLNINSSLFTSLCNNSIERVCHAINDSVIYNTYRNIGSNKRVGLSLNGSWQFVKAVRLNMNSNLTYLAMTTSDGSGLSNKGLNYSLMLGSQFTLPYNITYSINGTYYSPRVRLQGKNDATYFYYMTLSKDLFDHRLNFSLVANNPFTPTFKNISYIDTRDYRAQYTSINIARTFSLAVIYRFGQLKDEIKKVERTINNDDLKGGGNR